MGLLKGEWVLLTTLWFSSFWINLWMGIIVFCVVLYCRRCTIEVVIGTCCFSPFSSLTVDGFSDSSGKVFNCLMSFVFTVVILNVYLSFFGFLNYLFWSKFMFNIHGVFGLVTIGCVFYSFLVSLTSAFTNVNSCDPPVTLVMEIDSAPTCLDGISVHCALVLTNVLYFCGFDVLG